MSTRPYSVCLFLLCGFLITSCVGIKTYVIEDPDRNRTIYQLRTLFTDVSRDFVGPYGNMSIAIEMHVPFASVDTSFYIRALTLSPNRWTISSGDTMSLTIDGRRTYLLCSQPRVSGQDDGVTMQHTPYYLSGGSYKVNRLVVRSMANASTVDIGIHAAEGVITGRLTKSKLEAIGKFQGRYFP
ncbi:MAG: hypothetical protein JSU65_05245 [Candidatus Zixiibacteriota bacterium]|nr:MAG: hypothetical protein JSU65_05245 [candidate division Zixibacteria bacterium]